MAHPPQGGLAVRTPVAGRAGQTIAGSKWRQATTDFAKQLAGFAAIVEVEELRGYTAVGATTGSRQGVGAASANRGQRPTMFAQILSTQLLPVQGQRGCRSRGWLGQGSVGIDVKIAVVRMRGHPSIGGDDAVSSAGQETYAGGLLNMQQQLPPIPVGATVRVQVPSGRRVTQVVSIPEQKTIPFEKAEPYTQFRLQPFDALAMALVECEQNASGGCHERVRE